ncbi:lysozyme [Roseibium hamelinense]|uniref:Lysozyme n=1 Tax=Roseibium hamelinense TaxID=150831 RepID=A0A562T0S0_9HYPH|nr:GH25 family lysozyme [Roseibium hamelinense]MTI44543.1 glycosyl hydrolase family 25 [Roseibium hamelinense]TWI87167.1 lysozyme [Roseibium hamelinense]
MSETGQRGIDVSHYQGTVNWQGVAASGIDFAYLKATEGTGYTDPTFKQNWSGCQEYALKCGGYHYFLPRDSFLQQAEAIVQAMRSVGYSRTTDLPPAIDCEEMDGCSAAEYVHALAGLVSLVERFLCVRPMIYTNPSFWDGLGNPDFSEYPLWLAQYTDAQSPTVPAPWSSYTIWQYSDQGTVSGIGGFCDCDLANSSLNVSPPGTSILKWY